MTDLTKNKKGTKSVQKDLDRIYSYRTDENEFMLHV